MYCNHCESTTATKGYFMSDNGFKWRVIYCQQCERVTRIGNSVPDVGNSYKGSYVRMHDYKQKGGNKH